MKSSFAFLVVLFVPIACLSQTTRPSTQPSTSSSPQGAVPGDQLLDQMLKPPANATKVLEPLPDHPTRDTSSGNGAVKPDAPPVNLRREGTFIVDATGRLTRSKDGHEEFTFESDGKTLKDPPMIILPNQTLMQMEESVTAATKDLRFHVSGMITEYRGRNYILLERAVAIPDIAQQF